MQGNGVANCKIETWETDFEGLYDTVSVFLIPSDQKLIFLHSNTQTAQSLIAEEESPPIPMAIMPLEGLDPSHIPYQTM
jgi:hypothetical protein